MNALAPNPTSSPVAKLPMPQISPGLNSLLTLEPSAERAVREIATTPALLAEAERVLPALRDRAITPAGIDGVQRVVGSRRALFPQPERTPGESAAWWADYYDALEHLPEGAIEAAMQAWVKMPDAEFMPKPGKLLELAKITPNRAIKSYERAKAALEYRTPSAAHPADDNPNYIDQTVRGVVGLGLSKPRQEPSRAEKDHVRAMCRRFLAEDDERRAVAAAKAKGSAPIPDTADPTDGKGLTPQMRELMAKHRPAMFGGEP